MDCDAGLHCTPEQAATDLFCFAAHVGGFDELELDGFCAATGELYIGGDDGTCCQAGDRCVEACGLDAGATYCLSEE